MTKICLLMRENEAKKSVQALMISKRKVSLRSYDQRKRYPYLLLTDQESETVLQKKAPGPAGWWVKRPTSEYHPASLPRDMFL